MMNLLQQLKVASNENLKRNVKTIWATGHPMMHKCAYGYYNEEEYDLEDLEDLEDSEVQVQVHAMMNLL